LKTYAIDVNTSRTPEEGAQVRKVGQTGLLSTSSIIWLHADHCCLLISLKFCYSRGGAARLGPLLSIHKSLGVSQTRTERGHSSPLVEATQVFVLSGVFGTVRLGQQSRFLYSAPPVEVRARNSIRRLRKRRPVAFARRAPIAGGSANCPQFFCFSR
jgi:hypothetical protein